MKRHLQAGSHAAGMRTAKRTLLCQKNVCAHNRDGRDGFAMSGTANGNDWPQWMGGSENDGSWREEEILTKFLPPAPL